MDAVLVIQDADEEAILRASLRRAGLNATSIPTLEQISAFVEHHTPTLLVLALPANDPLRLVRQARDIVVAPLVLIIPPAQEALYSQLLDEGADLVRSRPYSAAILISEVRSLLRRTRRASRPLIPSLHCGHFFMDAPTRTVQRAGSAPCRLTQKEFQLFHTLITHCGQPLMSETLIEHVWGYTGEGDGGLLRNLVKRLRDKLEPDPRQPQYLRTLPGVGYLLWNGDSMTIKGSLFNSRFSQLAERSYPHEAKEVSSY